MKRIRNFRPSPATIIALAALGVSLGGVAYATIPDSSGTIHACYQKSQGNLRVVESASDCRASEAAIDWSQRGQPGSGSGVVFAEDTSVVSTTSRTDVDLGGPQVQVMVPASGLVGVLARAEGHGVCSPSSPPCAGAFIVVGVAQPYVDAEPVSASQVTMIGNPPGTAGFERQLGDWKVFETSPGLHTISLRYRTECNTGPCPSTAGASFRNRKVWAEPIG
jgi:hypothetical protein